MHKLFLRYRYSLVLLKQLVITDFKLRYKGSFLGYFWSLLRPLFLFAITYFVFVYFLGIGDKIPHWPVALLLGIVMWNFFAEVTNNGLTAIVNRGDIIRKINFPKYVIVIAGVASATINLILNLLVVGIAMIINGVDLSWMSLLTPLYFIELIILSLGLAFLLSALFVRLRDINYIWEIIMQGLFYASAIVYPVSYVISQSRDLAIILLLNPVSQPIQDVRHVLISSKNESLYSITGSVLISSIPIVLTIFIFIAGAWYFRRQSPTFAENV